MTSKQRVLTIKISVTVSFLLWSSKGHEPKAPLHNTKIRCLLLPQLSSVSSPSTNFWNKIKCRQVSAVLQKWEKNYFLWIYQKLIIATFIPGTKYSEENLFLPRAQSERKKSTSRWLLTFLKDRALGVGETRISLKCDTSSRQTFPGLIPTDDQEICLSWNNQR